MTKSGLTLALAAPLLVLLLEGCVPAAVGVAVGVGAYSAMDRRTTGAQVDDETIEDKTALTLNERFKGSNYHINVTSYNGIVLLTGEVPSPDIVRDIGETARTTAKVRVVHNEIVVAAVSPVGSRTNDSYITSKVKTRFVEKNKFSATHVKVVTDRQVVYLMGLVKRDEADNAAQIASTTEGVLRVVKLFEPIS